VLQDDKPSYLRSAGFADTLTGWVGSLDGVPLLYATTDGGAVWSPVLDIPEPQPTGICGIWVVNRSVVYACGKYDGSSARVLRTTDGGASWTSQDLVPLANSLIDCFFFDEDHGFVVGGIGLGNARRAVILATTDGGATWATRHTTDRTAEWCWKISFPTASIGYVSIERFNGPSYFLKTTDGGETWQDHLFHNSYIVQGIGFATPDLGWIGGPTGPTYESTDGGESWQLAGFGVHINRFRFLGPSIGYAAGSTVYKYTTSTAVADAPPGSPVITLAQNHPNPFNASTTIAYTLSREADVRVSIVDVQGRRVATLVDASRTPGAHEVRWHARDAAGRPVGTGVYWYRLESGRQVEAGKLMIVK
jgi:photosystem II stability/assembly factor-like uncharacterized protein